MADPYAQDTDSVLRALKVSAEDGLSTAEARRRRKRYGPNALREGRRKSSFAVLVDQFRSLVTYLLGAAATVSFLIGDLAEAAAIAIVIALNATIGFVTEIRALRSMEALRRLGRVTTRVIRNGKPMKVPAQSLVPGDIVLLEAGDVVTADLRLVEASKLQCDESMLTGESLPVAKGTLNLNSSTPLVERHNMAFKGTGVTTGSGLGVVVSTGLETELGQISNLVEEAQAETTPLEKRLGNLARQLMWLALGLGAIVFAVGVVSGKSPALMFDTGIALAVAAVPEGLPIVATLALARGMWRMARRNALIERLSAVEALGATTVIFADKTGTLTENRMTATDFILPSGHLKVVAHPDATDLWVTENGEPVDPLSRTDLNEAFRVCALCTNASLSDDFETRRDAAQGDPTETALLIAAAIAGFDRSKLLQELPEIREEAFDPNTKMMATFHQTGEGYLIAVKGAPEAVIERAGYVLSPDRPRIMTEERRRGWMRLSDVSAYGTD